MTLDFAVFLLLCLCREAGLAWWQYTKEKVRSGQAQQAKGDEEELRVVEPPSQKSSVKHQKSSVKNYGDVRS